MSDYSELNARALAAIDELSESGQRWPEGDDWFEPELCSAELEFVKAASPEVIKALIADNKQSRATSQYWKDEHLAANALIDQLKAENEALRKDAERYRWLRQYTVDSYGAQGSFESLDRDIDAAMGKGEQS